MKGGDPEALRLKGGRKPSAENTDVKDADNPASLPSKTRGNPITRREKPQRREGGYAWANLTPYVKTRQ